MTMIAPLSGPWLLELEIELATVFEVLGTVTGAEEAAAEDLGGEEIEEVEGGEAVEEAPTEVSTDD